MGSHRPLGDLLGDVHAVFDGDGQTPVSGVTYDSRVVQPGNGFVAIPGFVHDGLQFVPEALERGAAAIVAERPPEATGSGPRPQCWAHVEDARAALAAAACEWYGHPSRDLPVIGVTGTNGKTTVSALLEKILMARGSIGVWTTTRVQIGAESYPTPRTTPEAPELQQALARMVELGCSGAVIEVSSHALRLQRVAGTRFAAAVFTNLTPDHLDFHTDMDDYLAAKAMLFAPLAASAPAVVNVSDPSGAALTRQSGGRIVTYGWQAEASDVHIDYAIAPLPPQASGSLVRLHTPRGELALRTPLIGRANAENIAAAVAVALEMDLGIDRDTVGTAVAGFRGEPGRLEPLEHGQDFQVLVDFAHTPGALEAAIEAARGTLTSGRLIVVFGCGGDRDRAKRPLMGRVAAAGADVTIVTSDNPRGESPEAIIDEILSGMSHAQRRQAQVQPDRAIAIETAVGTARTGDCVLIAGKGHETEQVFADRVIPFDDRLVAGQALRRRSPAGSRS